ncbi:hypothetical protein K3495_g6536 [Podosphaera aphanis]|nr:hypothetical protein K3495_g6536 [Podosphaera aphanis]
MTPSHQNHQVPMADPTFNAQEASHPSSPLTTSVSDNLHLSDILSSSPSINVFAGFIRHFSTINQRVENSALNTTILAPINNVVMSLPQKPWETVHEYNTLGKKAYEGTLGRDRAQKNIRNFVEAHILPLRPWREGEKARNLAGNEYWWEVKNGIKMIQPGNIKVIDDSRRVRNGDLWIIDSVIG